MNKHRIGFMLPLLLCSAYALLLLIMWGVCIVLHFDPLAIRGLLGVLMQQLIRISFLEWVSMRTVGLPFLEWVSKRTGSWYHCHGQWVVNHHGNVSVVHHARQVDVMKHIWIITKYSVKGRGPFLSCHPGAMASAVVGNKVCTWDQADKSSFPKHLRSVKNDTVTLNDSTLIAALRATWGPHQSIGKCYRETGHCWPLAAYKAIFFRSHQHTQDDEWNWVHDASGSKRTPFPRSYA